MKITLVRHGKTQSNQEHRYLGWTDELLCREGIALLLKKMRKGLYPQSPDRVVCSPMRRCIQTAAWICPKGYPYRIEDDLRETNFGIFEGKTYEELKEDPTISGGLLPTGKGPSRRGSPGCRCARAALPGLSGRWPVRCRRGKRSCSLWSTAASWRFWSGMRSPRSRFMPFMWTMGTGIFWKSRTDSRFMGGIRCKNWARRKTNEDCLAADRGGGARSYHRRPGLDPAPHPGNRLADCQGGEAAARPFSPQGCGWREKSWRWACR